MSILCIFGIHDYAYELAPFEGGIRFVHYGTCSRCGRVIRKVTDTGHDYELKRTRGELIKKGN